MERIKKTTTTTYYNKDTKKSETTTNVVNYVVKTWDELTREQKEQEIEDNLESIYTYYQDDLQYMYREALNYIREKFDNITFDDIYFDSCSQGSWIDEVKGFRYNDDGLYIYNTDIYITNIDLHFNRHTIKPITGDDISLSDWDISCGQFNRIIKTKKFKRWINGVIDDVNEWIDAVNKETSSLLDNEYNAPTNLDDANDADFLATYFGDREFTYYEDEGSDE